MLLINMVLSGDNAVVIAMACKNLPPEHRTKAVWWGAGGAVALRLLLTAGAVVLLDIPLIRAVGSLLLLYIAIKLLTDHGGVSTVRQAGSLSGAIWTIIMADFIMSLDNVLAVAALANGNMTLLIAGIAMSIPLIIWGSSLIMRWMNRYPVLVLLGAAILGYTAGKMMVEDPIVQPQLLQFHASALWLVPLLFTSLAIGVGLWHKGRNAL
ncbi:TerC family protein [Xylanibacillus composti]|nr:TerC family protein [Xylanibacillus composti]